MLGRKIYIQTDKGVHKPQDLVQFRIVVLDEHTRPLNIREWRHCVYIKHDQNIVIGDRHIKVIVYGKYTFNKYVEGNATVELWYSHSKMLRQRSIKIKTLAMVQFVIEDMNDFSAADFLVAKVKLTEKHTDITRSENSKIQIRAQCYNIKVPDNEIEFRDNKPYRLKAQVEYWSGAAVMDRKTPVLMEHGDSAYESYLAEKGEALFEFEHQKNANHIIHFKDSQQVLPNIFANNYLLHTKTEYYCNLKLIGNRSSN